MIRRPQPTIDVQRALQTQQGVCAYLPGALNDVFRDGRFLIDTVLDDAPLTHHALQNWTPPVK